MSSLIRLNKKDMSLQRALQEIDYVTDVLKQKGVMIQGGSRLKLHRKVIEEQSLQGFIDPKAKQFKCLAEALRETRELFIIFSQESFVKNISETELHALVSGQQLAMQDKNTNPRDIQYQLFLASLFHKAGLEVRLTEPDVKCKTTDGKDVEFSIAVKRLKSLKKLETRVREAWNQIEKHNMPGIIALSVEVAANPSFDPVPYNYNLGETIEALYEKHKNKFTPRPRNYCLMAGVLLTFWAWALPPEVMKNLPEKSKIPITIPFQVGWGLKFIPYEYEFSQDEDRYLARWREIPQIVEGVLKGNSYLMLGTPLP